MDLDEATELAALLERIRACPQPTVSLWRDEALTLAEWAAKGLRAEQAGIAMDPATAAAVSRCLNREVERN